MSIGAKYQAIVCTACEHPHYDVHDTFTGYVVEATAADAHGHWESGFGDTVEEAKADAVSAYEFRSSQE